MAVIFVIIVSVLMKGINLNSINLWFVYFKTHRRIMDDQRKQKSLRVINVNSHIYAGAYIAVFNHNTAKQAECVDIVYLSVPFDDWLDMAFFF